MRARFCYLVIPDAHYPHVCCILVRRSNHPELCIVKYHVIDVPQAGRCSPC